MTLPTTSPSGPGYQITWLSATGIAGFITGCFILFLGNFSCSKPRQPVFHDITWSIKGQSFNEVNAHIDSLKRDRDHAWGAYAKLTGNNNDTAKIIKQERLEAANRDAGLINKLTQYKEIFRDSGNTDMLSFKALNSPLNLKISQDSLRRWDSAFVKDGRLWESPPVEYTLQDPAIPLKPAGHVIFSVQTFPFNIAYIAQHPEVGIWLLLVLIYSSFCFLAFTMCCFLSGKVKTLADPDPSDKGRYALICVIMAVVLFIIAWIWKHSFYDASVVKDLYFMGHLEIVELSMLVLGSISGALCLSGFIYTAPKLSALRNQLVTEVKNAAALSAALQTTLSQNAAAAPAVQAQLDQAEIRARDLKARQEELSGVFNTYFILAAIILSTMVLCSGALYNTANSLEFVKLLTQNWGFSPVRTDFIYLYGGLYTVILLLVYIPVRMHVSEAGPGTPAAAAATATNGKWYEWVKDPFAQLKTVLAAASPLLVSLLQTLFDLLFK
ncbi:hypothetical protein [Chitinophaga barathri]|uniref:Uncharacterized protein n=1 Tax=Chitinophaga barathri TaxID=1647451 RepID=A0A3N4MGR3_9BACT|nr:hypothetical protein [Chitinophaga barathri]RPD42778.1 hypothetical protein EG028_00320 [Chitinophaga barathri]